MEAIFHRVSIRKIIEDLSAFAIIPCGYPAEERAQDARYDRQRVHLRWG